MCQAKEVRQIIPNEFHPGDEKDIVIEGSGFNLDRREYEVTITEGEGKQKKTWNEKKYDTFKPSMSCSAPGAKTDEVEFVSPTSLRTKLSVPASCAPGNYDIVVTNPDGKQVMGKNKLIVLGILENKIRCPSCKKIVEDKKWCSKCGIPLHSSITR